MQKKVIALAVAGLVSGAAFAQSNVTIYGVADAGYVYGTGERTGALNKNANFSGIQSGLLAGSRIGFRGEEGLGNGLKAIFTLEYALAMDSEAGIGNGAAGAAATNGATGGTNSRQQFVGLSHAKLGTVALGQQYAPSFYSSGRNDAFLSSTGIGSLARLTIVGDNSISGTNPSRWTNAVTYASPTWSGFSVRAAYGFGESSSAPAAPATAATAAGNGVSRGDNGKFGVGGNYANGPLNLDLVYHSRQGVSTTANATQDSINEWYLGGSYDFKVVKISGSYQDKSDNNGTSANELGNNIWQVGATMPVFGNGKVYAGYSKLSYDQSGAGDIKAWNLMYTHSLSKRTTLYTGVTRFDNDNSALAGASGASNSGVGGVGEANTTYAAGINHSF
jgi:predicted porin